MRSEDEFHVHGTRLRLMGLNFFVQKCSHWSETGTGPRTHCFSLVSPVLSVYLVQVPCSVTKP